MTEIQVVEAFKELGPLGGLIAVSVLVIAFAVKKILQKAKISGILKIEFGKADDK